MVFFTYFRFIFINLVKKWSTWVFAILYMVFTFAFLYIVPLLMKTDPWLLWQNTMVAPQMMLLYIAAIYSSVISISVFKEYRDNGTELLLVSKPIARGKIIAAKFLLLISFCIVFAIVSSAVGLVVFALPDITNELAFSLVGSIAIANFLAMFLLSIFATIISLFANKVWTILVTIILVVMFTILSTVSNLTIKTPAGLAKDEGHAIVASNYLGNDHKEHSIGALSPFSVTGSSQGINFTNIDEEKAYWKQYENKSGVKIINAVDIMGQFQNLNNMFALEDVQSSKASSFFGENHWYDYELDDKAIVNQPVDTQPMFYVTIPSGGLVLNNINNLDKLLDDPAGIEAVLSTITNYISGQNIVMIGETSADVSSIATPFTLKKFSVVENHNGWTGSRNNLENLGYDDIAVQPYSGTVKDKLFRAMLNAQIGVKQKQDAGEYQFDDLNTNTHITNTCSYIDDYNSYTNFIHQTNPTSDFQPLTRSLAQLFTPSLNVGTAEVISSTDQAYTNLFANGTSYAEYFTSSKNKGMDFPHFCFVGSNYSEENGNPRIEIRDPDTGEKLVLKNQLWQGTDETKASKALMNLMAQYKLFAFEYLTNVIKKSETSQNVSSVYDTAYNTKLGFDMNNLNINFNSSPLFLVQPNSSGSYSYMNDFINVPFIGELGEIFGILFALCPNLYQDARVQQIISFINLLLPEQDKIDWVGSWGNSYFGDPKVLNARAFLSWFTSKQEYGWKTALNPIDYDVIEANVTNLVTNVSSSGMNNFPAIYENLSAPFATNPYFEPWQIAIVWFLVGTILSAFAIVIYMRSDFK